jgi:hypothetical protein
MALAVLAGPRACRSLHEGKASDASLHVRWPCPLVGESPVTLEDAELKIDVRGGLAGRRLSGDRMKPVTSSSMIGANPSPVESTRSMPCFHERCFFETARGCWLCVSFHHYSIYRRRGRATRA